MKILLVGIGSFKFGEDSNFIKTRHEAEEEVFSRIRREGCNIYIYVYIDIFMLFLTYIRRLRKYTT